LEILNYYFERYAKEKLAYEVDEQKGKIYIKRGFLQIIKEEGFQMASLIDLAQAVEGEYKRIHNEKPNFWSLQVSLSP
jgi:hypothetical protein